MTPRTLYRRIALAEVVTWALLLLGMVLKYVTRTTDLGVKVFGLAHGVVFIAFCLVTVLLWVNQRWTRPRGAARPAQRGAALPHRLVGASARAPRAPRRVAGASAATATPRPTRPSASSPALLARPMVAVGVGIVAVLALTGVALLVGTARRPAGLTCSSGRSERVRSQAAYGGFRQRDSATVSEGMGADGCGRSADR